MRRLVLVFMSTIVAQSCVGHVSELVPHDDQAAETVLSIVTDGLERLRKGDPRGITDACAEDVTYYSVEQDSLLVGRQILEEMYGPPTGLPTITSN